MLDLSENGSLPMETLHRIQQQCAYNRASYEAANGGGDPTISPMGFGHTEADLEMMSPERKKAFRP